MTVQKSLSKLNCGQNIIFSAGSIINLLMAANDVSMGKMTPGDFFMINAYFMQLAGPLFNMGTLFREVQQTQIDVEDLFNMLHRRPEILESPDAVDFAYGGGSIEFRGVSFKHKQADQKKGNQPDFLFENFSLDIKPGTTNAIVGRSGFGKTTLLYLLFRIYDPDQG